MNHNDRAAAARVALGTALEETIEVQSEKFPELKGSITFSLPNGKDLMRIAIIQHDLREGRPLESLDNLSGGLAVVMSTLAIVVRKAPDWWYQTVGEGKDARKVAAPELLKDTSMLYDIWGRFVAFRDTFPGRGTDEPDHPAATGAQSVSAGDETQQAAV